MNLAKTIVEVNRKWAAADRATIVKNVTRKLESGGYVPYEVKVSSLADWTDSNKDAVGAWLNNSRKNVKIPFIKLCMIAAKLNADINEFLEDKSMKDFEQKFAVSRLIGDDEEFLKFFGPDEKDAALAYGAEVAKTNTTGTIGVYRAWFNANNEIKDNAMEIFHSWKAE